MYYPPSIVGSAEVIEINLSEKQSLAWQYLEDNETTEILYGGAAGGGKSMLGCIWQIYRRLKYPGTRGFIARRELKALKASTLVTFFDVARQMGYSNGKVYKYNPSNSTITFMNDSVITLVDLAYMPSDPDYETLGSVPFTDGFIDEAGEVRERAAEIIKSRIRYKIADYGLIPKILYCSNPSDSWLKSRFVKDKNGEVVKLKPYQKYIQAKLLDNPDPKFRAVYQRQLESLTSAYDRARLLDGDWDAHPRTGQEYYHNFNHDIHVRDDFDFEPNRATHISFDFNSHPYMTMLEIQIEVKAGIWNVYVIDEYCFTHPHNTTYDVVQAFKQKRWDKLSALYYYGDHTGKNLNTAAMQNIRHNYDVVELVLAGRLNNNSDRVIPNQPVLIRKEFVIDILSGKLPIRLNLHRRCKNLIHEMTFMKEQPDGTKHVEMTKDEITGKPYEKYGHLTDALEYFLTSAFKDYYETYKRR
jgi:hypothetical protein